MKIFDIVLVQFPFSDLSASKLRPGLLVAIPGGENYVLVQITTKKRNITAYEVPLPRSACNGDIRFDSNIYVDMIATLNKSLIERKIGSVEASHIQEAVMTKLRNLFLIV